MRRLSLSFLLLLLALAWSVAGQEPSLTVLNVDRFQFHSGGAVWMTIYPREGNQGFTQAPRRATIYDAAPDDMDVCFGEVYRNTDEARRCVSLGQLRRMLEVVR